MDAIDIYFQQSKISSFYMSRRHPTSCMVFVCDGGDCVQRICDILGPRRVLILYSQTLQMIVNVSSSIYCLL